MKTYPVIGAGPGMGLATVTVSTLVSPHSTGHEVTDAFWKLHAQHPADWQWETVVQ